MIIRFSSRLAAPFLLAVALGACGVGSSGAAETKRAPARVLPLTFERGGGIAGLQDRLRVRRDGRMTVAHAHATSPGGASRLGPRRRTSLRRAIRRAHLPKRAEYPGPSGSADDFHYLITIPGHRVEADGLGDPPPRIKRLISRLTALLSS